MTSKTLLLAGLLSLAAQAAFAQTPGPYSTRPADGFKHLSAAEQAAAVDKPGAGPTTAMISDHENWFSEVVARKSSGVVELHEHWIDIITILSGDATITYGGTYTGGQPTAPGEIRGGQISGGTSVEVHAGDYIQIPAGVPHLTSLTPGASLRLLVVKVRE